MAPSIDAIHPQVRPLVERMHPKDASTFLKNYKQYVEPSVSALEPGEKILGVGVADPEFLLATSTRLLSRGPGGKAEIFLHHLTQSRVEFVYRGGLYVPTLRIFTDEGGNRHLLYYPSKRKETTLPFIEALMDGIRRASKPPVAQNSNVSVADEIRKLAELLREGVLTQDEFDARKAELLGT